MKTWWTNTTATARVRRMGDWGMEEERNDEMNMKKKKRNMAVDPPI